MDRIDHALLALQEGLGSAYERHAVHRFLANLSRARRVRTVAEWPANGVLGVPGIKSLALARDGCEVTLLHPDESFHDDVAQIWRAAGLAPPGRLVSAPEQTLVERAFDLVWSFCAIEHVDDPDETLRAMLRASRGVVLVFVQNAFAPGVHLHRLEHLVRGQPWDHGRVADMRASAIVARVRAAGGVVLETGGCDLPPWPDLNVRLPRPWQRDDPRTPQPRRYGPGDPVLTARAAARVFDDPPTPSFMVRALLSWHDVVERRLPRALLRAIAHHPYVLARDRAC